MKKKGFLQKYLSFRYVVGLNQLVGSITLLGLLIYRLFFIPQIAQIMNPTLINELGFLNCLLISMNFIIPEIGVFLALFSSLEIFLRNRIGKLTIISLLLQLPYAASNYFGYKLALGVSVFFSFYFSGSSLKTESAFALGSGFKAWFIDNGQIMTPMFGINVVSLIFLVYALRCVLNKKS